MSFGKRLKKARQEKRLTQTQVAELVGIDDTTISKYENDKSEPDNETLKKLCELYAISSDWLYGRTSDPKKVLSDQARIFIDILHLPDEEILKRIDFGVEGTLLSEEQAKRFIRFVKAERALDNPDK